MIKSILARLGYVPVKESFISSFVRYMTIHTELNSFEVYTIIRRLENELNIHEYKAIGLIMNAPKRYFCSGYSIEDIVYFIKQDDDR